MKRQIDNSSPGAVTGGNQPVPVAQMVERPLREREVVGSILGRAIPKALKMVPVATLLGAQHYNLTYG